MRAEHIEQVLREIGCSKIKNKGDEIECSCPLAPYGGHKHGDKRPSFYVHIEVDDVSLAFCQGCKFRGTLSWLLWELHKKSGRDFQRLRMLVNEWDSVSAEKNAARLDAAGGHYATPLTTSSNSNGPGHVEGGKDYSDPLLRADMKPPLPESAVEIMEKMQTWIDDEAWSYLTGPERRLTPETITKWKIGWHPRQRRISVPQYDRIGRLVNLSGRYLPYWPEEVPLSEGEKKAPKWMHTHGFDRELYLFGEDWLNTTGHSGTVFVVEGAFDVIYLDQCGIPNVAGINGSYINDTQVDKILKWFDFVVILMDGDKPGIDAAEKIESRLKGRIQLTSYRIPDGRDPNQMTDNEVEDLKSRFLS